MLVATICPSSVIIQVLMKFMEMMAPDTEYLQQLTKKLAPPLGNEVRPRLLQ